MSELALTEEIKTLGLEKYAEELERDGLTIVPPEVNGFGMDRIDEIVELILARAREMTGCTFTLDGGPQQELEFPKREFTPKQSISAASARLSACSTNAYMPSPFSPRKAAIADEKDLSLSWGETSSMVPPTGGRTVAVLTPRSTSTVGASVASPIP